MTPERLKECRDILHWGPRAIAKQLGRHHSTIQQWDEGRVKIPQDVATWLETLVKFHVMFPAPVWEKRDTRKKGEGE
jgi:DNA-binding transcriptional regulator YiaG